MRLQTLVCNRSTGVLGNIQDALIDYSNMQELIISEDQKLSGILAGCLSSTQAFDTVRALYLDLGLGDYLSDCDRPKVMELLEKINASTSLTSLRIVDQYTGITNQNSTEFSLTKALLKSGPKSSVRELELTLRMPDVNYFRTAVCLADLNIRSIVDVVQQFSKLRCIKLNVHVKRKNGRKDTMESAVANIWEMVNSSLKMAMPSVEVIDGNFSIIPRIMKRDIIL
ncbi:hypothetical protein BDQ17DRAFT_1368144 [Cyathus striatus]|nr:hypothetical protein BDQ17DRAFT_1368144 [Cyathus striatus]